MEIIREILNATPINNSLDARKYLDEFKNQDREFFAVIGLDTQRRPTYREIAHMGTLNKTLIHPREIFKKAIITSSDSIIVAHNHPSGSLVPSDEDKRVLNKLKAAAEILGIDLLDSIIIAEGGYHSMCDNDEIWEEERGGEIYA